jgi:hypothetical protein
MDSTARHLITIRDWAYFDFALEAIRSIVTAARQYVDADTSRSQQYHSTVQVPRIPELPTPKTNCCSWIHTDLGNKLDLSVLNYKEASSCPLPSSVEA